jgi:ligand-binding sensor domain-containing protein
MEGYSVLSIDPGGFWIWNGIKLSGPIVPEVLRWKDKTHSLGLDCEGRFWAGNYEGLYRQDSPNVLDAGRWESVAPGTNVVQSLVFINDITHNDNSIWIASQSEGLWWYLNTCSESPNP